MEKMIELPKGTEVKCRLSMSPQITHVVKAVIKKYCRVYGTQTVIDDKDPKIKKYFPVNIVEVKVMPTKSKAYIARIDARCIVTDNGPLVEMSRKEE